MDEWLTLGQVASKLNIHEHDLFDAALKSEIKLIWKPNFPICLYDVDVKEGIPQWVDYDNSEDGPIENVRVGFFEIDLKLCPGWREPLLNIKTGGLGYGFDFFDSLDPLAVKQVNHDDGVFSVTSSPDFNVVKVLDFPTIQTLGIFKKELDKYQKELDSLISLSTGPENKLEMQCKAILNELEKLGIPFNKVPQYRKREVERAVSENKQLFNAVSGFKNAWAHLSSSGVIKTY